MADESASHLLTNQRLTIPQRTLIEHLLTSSVLPSGGREQAVLRQLANSYPDPVLRDALKSVSFGGAKGVTESTIGVAAHRLKTKLADYFEHDGRSQPLKCTIRGIRHQGTWLVFIDQDNLPGLTGMFWQPHLFPAHDKDILIVTNEVLCFRDNKTNVTIRFFDFNPRVTDNEGALHELSRMDMTPYRHIFSEDFLKQPDLRASYIYTPSGEVEARFAISSWFDNNAGITTTRLLSSEGVDFAKYSPILIVCWFSLKWREGVFR
jgi:hypothetical protein